jgi:FkbM family methyltransferase
MMKPLQAIFFRDFPNSYIPDILEEVYIKKVYAPFVTGKKDLIIADVGGNIGLTTYYFKDYAKRVYIVEPAKLHQKTIETMLDYNKITNVTLCPYAITNKNGTTKFYHNENSTMYSLSDAVNEKKDDYEEVEIVTFDEFMKRNKLDHLDILKLDVEGSECEVVASEGFKKYAPNIKVVLGEWHSWAKCEQVQFANMFTDLGFQFRWLRNTKAACFTAVRL